MFWQAIDSLCEEFRCGMFVCVKFLIGRSIAQPEIGAEINHTTAVLKQGHSKLGSDTMRKSEKNDFGLLGDRIDMGISKAERLRALMAGKFGKDFCEWLACLLARSDGGQFSVWMLEEQAHEFFAGITRGANDCYFDRTFHFVRSYRSGAAQRSKFYDQIKKPAGVAGGLKKVESINAC